MVNSFYVLNNQIYSAFDLNVLQVTCRNDLVIKDVHVHIYLNGSHQSLLHYFYNVPCMYTKL